MRRRSLTVLFLTLFGAASPAPAQPASSLADAIGRLTPGTTVAIETGDGPTVRGRFQQATDSELVVERDGSSARVRLEKVTAVRVRQFDSLWNGAIIGFGIGALAGLWPDYYDDCEECHDSLYVSMAMGTGIGIGIDALRRRWAPLYRSHSTGARLIVRPALGGGQTALHLVVDF